ncbi:cable pilus system response regulator transcription factor CblR [Burkholderia sp. AU33545]|uniref:Two-component regulatory system response regulator protein n=2 Tax=Burkholderiaceae TaxID=119060 RepID=A0A6P2JQ51_9BURK|nr:MULTISPECIES: cable pilus system response regulator transcription factor CblR [Burkholderia]MCA8202346.1 cable pilus system response regulator transcription factor CblR [Burkholderia sp. AU33545]RQR81313.1 DNA-binding response regulator [Burkholderia sp. Bp9012]RQZ68721.1 DNA-binding response regulator [Burkholderia sp. Bp9004]AOI94247.1 LuxR family transcriptional regulator [Burkholderia sp. LA-2-3-30-S1-D2]KAB0651266.1 response regulator transcription factor [Burkholderia diffusa]
MRPELQPIRVVILDDHAVVQHGIASYLTERTGIEVAASFARSRDLISWLESNHADVVLLDYTLGPDEIDGLNLVKLVSTRFPDCRILMTSSSDTPATVNMTMRAGALGFFGKSENLRELVHAIRVVAEGRSYISTELAGRVMASATPVQSVAAPKPAVSEDAPAAESESSADLRLSPREHEVLRCYLAGMSVSDIALKFSRSRKTISAQKQSAYRKLGIRSDAELFASRKLLEKQ